MGACTPCGAEWGGAKLEHCTVCHETFTSTPAGDKHRTGGFANGSRRCRTPEEMLALGMGQNLRGYWVSSRQNTPDSLVQYGLESPGSNPATQPLGETA